MVISLGRKVQVKDECSKHSLPYEPQAVQYIWWAQPFTNISQNRVPPPQQMVVQNQSIKLFWIGTSISEHSINTDEVGKQTKIEITKAKLFTIIGDGKIKLQLNLKDRAKSLVEGGDTDMLSSKSE